MFVFIYIKRLSKNSVFWDFKKKEKVNRYWYIYLIKSESDLSNHSFTIFTAQ